MPSEQKVIEAIEHYQKKLLKYTESSQTDKVLCCIHRLKYLPVTVEHLEVTLVGRTINKLRHQPGQVRTKALEVLDKWKKLVAKDPSSYLPPKGIQEPSPNSVKKPEKPDSQNYDPKISSHISSKTYSSENSHSSASTKRNHSHETPDILGSSGSSKVKEKSDNHDKHQATDKHASKKSSSSSHSSKRSSSHSKKKKDTSHLSKKKEKKSSKKKSSHMTCFEEALLGIEAPRKHQKKSNDIDKPVVRPQELVTPPMREDPETFEMRLPSPQNVSPPSCSFKEIGQLSVKYKPLPHVSPEQNSKNGLKLDQNEEGLDYMYNVKLNRQRQKYIGKASRHGRREIPTLFSSCLNVISQNLDNLEATGGVPYDILKPALEKATPKQLMNIEYFNPYLLEDSDELWELLCKRTYKNLSREDMETWRDMFIRCTDEKQSKLKNVMERLSNKFLRDAPEQRKVQMAYFPGGAPSSSRHQSKLSYDTTPVKENLHKFTSADSNNKVAIVPKRHGSVKLPRPAAQKKPKTAPAMMKTMQLYKKIRRR